MSEVMEADKIILLLNFEGNDGDLTTTDESDYNHTVTLTGSQIDDSQAKWGNTSLELDGSVSYATIPFHSKFNIYNDIIDTYTVDMWVKHTNHSGDATFEYYMSVGVDADNRYSYFVQKSTANWLFVKESASTIIQANSSSSITDNNWHHLMWYKSGNVSAHYIDGTQAYYVADNDTVDLDLPSSYLWLGSAPGYSFNFAIHLDAVRMYEGNLFNASPDAGLTDTITVPTGAPVYPTPPEPTLTITIDTDPSYAILPQQEKVHNKPFNYITLEVNGTTYDITDYLKRVPMIDRQKLILPETISGLKTTTAIFTVINDEFKFSPQRSESFFYRQAWFDAKITVYSGFYTNPLDIHVTSQLVSYLQEVRVDTQTNTSKLICEGIGGKILRKKVGEPDSDGNADPLEYAGTQSFKTIVEDLLSTHAGLTSDEYDVQDINLNFEDISFTNVTVTSAVASLCQAASCEFYEDRFGKIKIASFEPKLGGIKYTALHEDSNILRLFSSEAIDKLIYKVAVTGDTGVFADGSEEVNANGRTVEITNSYVQTDPVASDIVDRFFERFGSVYPVLEAEIDFMPVLDLGDLVTVTESQTGIPGLEFEVYRIQLDLQNYKGKVWLLKSDFNQNFGFLASNTSEPSDPEAPEAYSWDDADARDRQFCYLGDRDLGEDDEVYYVCTRR